MAKDACGTGFVMAAAIACVVAIAGPATAQSLQRSTAQPLGAAGAPARPNGNGSSPTATTPLSATPTSTTPAPTGPGASNHAPQHFQSEADAKTACGSQPVVWGNTRSKVFYVPGTKYYGKTRRGTFMCQDTAMAGGYHAPKS